jgi:hypothetical protein
VLRWLIELLRRILRWLEDLYHRLEPVRPPPANCPISWQPSALAPVFYGVRDYGTAERAPGPCRVFFPSLDGAVFDAPILEGCGRYPLILFAHGHCDESEHYKKWFVLPAQLARSGYVVVVPELPAIGTHPSTDNHPALSRIGSTLAWMREVWEHRQMLLPPPQTGIIGHSYGALLSARFAVDNPISTYASIAGVWEDWPVGPRPITRLSIPMLFCLGTDDLFTNLSDPLWNSLTLPKHRAVFDNARHWDYLRPGASFCENGRGPCNLTGSLTADLVTVFLGKYLSPEHWPTLGNQIQNSLVPPQLILTAEQQFFAGGHLSGFALLQHRPGCRVSLGWETLTGSGQVALP